MIPGNFTSFNYLSLRSFIYFSFAMPSISCLDLSSASLSMSKDFIILFVPDVCIFYSRSTSSAADLSLLRGLFWDRWLKLVLTKLFLERQLEFIVDATIINLRYTLIGLFVTDLSVRNMWLDKHWFPPQMRVSVGDMTGTVLRVHASIKLLMISYLIYISTIITLLIFLWEVLYKVANILI